MTGNVRKFSKILTTGCVSFSVVFYLKSRDVYSSSTSRRPSEIPDHLLLRNVQIFIRHGARTPLKLLSYLEQPNWCHKEYSVDPPGINRFQYVVRNMQGKVLDIGPLETQTRKVVFEGGCFGGQLTMLGKQQMYDLGTKLREDYVDEIHFLSPAYDPDEIYVRSTNFSRTIESAVWLVSGLYPRKQSGAPTSSSKALPIYATTEEEEILYPNYGYCGALNRLSKRVMQHSHEIDGHSQQVDQLEKDLNYNRQLHKNRVDFIDLRDDIAARLEHKMQVNPVLVAWQEKVTDYSVKMLVRMVTGHNTPPQVKRELLRLACGPALHLVEQNMRRVHRKENHYKLQVYSCHDSLMISLILALGIFDGKWPVYAADLRFELFEEQDTGKFFIRVSYLGVSRELPGLEEDFFRGSKVYSLEKLRSFLADVTVDAQNLAELCQHRLPHTEPLPSSGPEESSYFSVGAPASEKK